MATQSNPFFPFLRPSPSLWRFIRLCPSGFHAFRRLLPCFDFGRVPGNVTNQLIAQVGTNQGLMHAGRQLPGRTFRKRP